MTIGPEHLGYWEDDRVGNLFIPELRAKRAPNVWVLNATSDSFSEDFWTGDPGSDTSAPVLLVTSCQSVDPGRALGRVELGGILQAPQPALVHLLGDPALMADMPVPTALVECGEDALYLGRAIARCCQPGSLGMMLIEVGRAVCEADLGQACAPRLEPLQSVPPGLEWKFRPR